MADTSQQELSEPHTNGAMDGLTEEEKSKMRPADIDADMREMERRKRVEMMMNSRLFREELERIIETQMKDGSGPSGLLQQISEMMGVQGARFNANVFKNSNCVVPINDIRGVESMGYAKGEKLLRCKLAAVFRLLDLYGWTQGVGGQITARLNQDQEHFLVNPYGLLYHEVTASSLVKVDMKASVVEQGTTNFGVHVTAFQLHSTIHAARPDIKCIIHINTPTVTAISSLKTGLLPLGQESIVIGEVSTHQYIGESALEPEEREKITRNLGPINKVMLLTNRGALCCGETVEEAFYNVYNTVLACETQLKLMPIGLENLNLISDEAKKTIFEASRKGPIAHGIGGAAVTSPPNAAATTVPSSIVEPSPLAEKLEKRWRIGGTEFEALMRMLDNAGFRTGYIYRHPLIKGEPPRPRNDVEVPPAVSSLGYLLEEEELYKQGLWKGGRKGTDRSRWLNSPNVYQKIEIQETGTPDPKKITKWVDQNAEEWVSDGSPTHSSTPFKIDSALQFVPKNTNPKEFKQLQQQIKDYRRADKISAGPQSHILEGVSWEEAKKMQDATISGTGEPVMLVGAASKGIIQRGFQHNAMVYKTPYAKNPFDAITDQELDQYKKEVERKHKGGPGGESAYDESQSESEALSSFNVSRATHESSTAKSPIQSPVSVTSETEEESRDEPRVLRIETKQVPLPSQPEVVLSDAQDATSQFLNEMRRDAVSEPRNERSSMKRDIITRRCNGVNDESAREWKSDHFDDVLRLKVSTSSTVAERMNVAPSDDQGLKFIGASSIDRVEAEKIGDNDATDSRYNTALSKRQFFETQSVNDLNCLDEARETIKSSKKIAEKIARFSRSCSVNSLSRLSESQRMLYRPRGYVRSLIEKYSRLESGAADEPSSRSEPRRRSASLVDFRIERTPRVGFVERVCLESRARRELSGEFNDENRHRSAPPNDDDIFNGNVAGYTNQTNLPDENGNPRAETTIRQGEEFVRQDSVTDTIKSMNGNITPSKIIMGLLPRTDLSMKYNLDATNMRLFYSITPTISDENLPDRPPSVKSQASSELDEISEFVWVDFKTSTNRDDEAIVDEAVDRSESSLETGNEFVRDDDDDDRTSNDGSDILELPMSTVLELKETGDESFSNDLSVSANEIIAHLGETEIHRSNENIIEQGDEKIKDIDDETIAELDALEDLPEQQDETDRPCDEPIRADNDNEKDEDEAASEATNRTDNSLIVINEIVHHIVDKYCNGNIVNGERDIFYSKRVKESTNIGIVKDMQTSVEANNNALNSVESETGDEHDNSVILEFRSLARANRNEDGFELNLSIERDENNINNLSDRGDECTDNCRCCLALFDSECNSSCQTHSSSNETNANSFQSIPESQATLPSEFKDNDVNSTDSREENRDCCCRSPIMREPWSSRQSYRCECEAYGSFMEYVDVEITDRDDCEEPIGSLKRNPLAIIDEEVADELLEDTDRANRSDPDFSIDNNENNANNNGELTTEHNTDFSRVADVCSVSKEDIDGEARLFELPLRTTDRNEIGEELHENNSNATYTISDSSDDDEADFCTYNADISTNINETRETMLIDDDDDASIESNRACFNVTENLADVSSLSINQDGKSIDCMTMSYETNEFVKLERQLSQDREYCRANDTDRDTENEPKSIAAWDLSTALETSPLKAPPKYEDTSLYRVVSRINLTDTITSNGEVPTINLQNAA